MLTFEIRWLDSTHNQRFQAENLSQAVLIVLVDLVKKGYFIEAVNVCSTHAAIFADEPQGSYVCVSVYLLEE